MARKQASPPPAPPAGLAEEERELWESLSAEYSGAWGPGDRLLLRSIVDVARRLREVGAALDAGGITVAGSMGQTRESPLLAVEQRLRAELDERLEAWSTRSRRW